MRTGSVHRVGLSEGCSAQPLHLQVVRPQGGGERGAVPGCEAHRHRDVPTCAVPHLWASWDGQNGHPGGGHQAGGWWGPWPAQGIAAQPTGLSLPSPQVWSCFKDARILACAPSNSAADLLCQRLLTNIAPRYIYRIMASSANYKDVPADVRVGLCPPPQPLQHNPEEKGPHLTFCSSPAAIGTTARSATCIPARSC